MDHASVVGIVQGRRYLPYNAKDRLEGDLRSPILLLSEEKAAEGPAGHIGHYKEEEPPRDARIQQGQNVRVVQPRSDLNFLEEPLRANRCRQIGTKELQGHVPAMF